MIPIKALLAVSVLLSLAACAGLTATQSPTGDGPVEVSALAASALTGSWAVSGLDDELDGDDKLYAQRTVQDALEYNRVGQTSTWRNPATGNSGTVTPKWTFRNVDGFDCRTFETAVFADGDRHAGLGTACRDNDGDWRVPG